MARTQKEKKLVRSTRIHHHLRTPSEGSETDFVVPKSSHMLLGVPSMEVTAAVASDRIIMWHVTVGNWGGSAAAAMYKDLGTSLRKRYGDRKVFNVVEDGDTKGFQSNLGRTAKASEKIKSWTIPPRSPGWMPLDYSIWDAIERRLYAEGVSRDETKDEFQNRLRRIALRLPRAYVKSTILKMKANIAATVASKGANTIATGGLD